MKNDGTINGHHLDLAVTLTGDTGLAKYIVFPQTVTNALRFGGAVAGTQSVRLDVPGYTAGDFEYGLFNGLDGSYFMGPANADNPKPTDATKNGMDLDGDGKVTLWDLSLAKIRITPGTVNAGINAGTTGSLWMNSIVDTTMGNDMQGKSVQATFTWTLHQDTTQF